MIVHSILLNSEFWILYSEFCLLNYYDENIRYYQFLYLVVL